MEELRGHHGTWRFDLETLRIRFGSGRKVPGLLRALGQCSVPLAAVREVDFHPGNRKHGWRLRLRLLEGADPYLPLKTTGHAEDFTPLLLTGPRDRELVAEYCAERLTESVQYARELLETPLDPVQAAKGLVARFPFHARTGEGSAFFNGERLRLQWDGWIASIPKGEEEAREFPFEEIESLQWFPSVGLEEGYLRVVPRGVTVPEKPELENDFCTLASHGLKGSEESLLMAATVNTHIALAGRGASQETAGAPAELTAPRPADDSAAIFAKIRELGSLHSEGLLTDSEFSTKKAELLDRL
ncbi:DUF4429 domain-containing protein [Nocardiopsis metallicus]|uniref:DUF4429 domain-containing protein n=1 Tax=Nocardiopsis metallicus TaxID=179819 RepID=A0A840WF23_9ACTN|nr:DUF4429 domain-containing protein [Nocardiopsis metallicus]MBB5495580.1 hypothetical protein [Nocardiopsis metallicus]